MLRSDQGHQRELIDAICDVLSEAGVSSAVDMQVRLHRRRFAALRRVHPLGTPGPSMTQALGAGLGPALVTARCAGLPAACALRGTSRAQASLMSEAIDQSQAMLPARDALSGLGGSAESFDPAGGTWRALPCMAQRRSAAAVGVVFDQLYVCGGFNGQEHLGSTERFEPALGLWRQLAAMRQRRSGASAAVIDGRLYVCGGTSEQGPVSSTECFSPAMEAWETLAFMGHRRCHAAVAVLKDNIYVCGGFDAKARLPGAAKLCRMLCVRRRRLASVAAHGAAQVRDGGRRARQPAVRLRRHHWRRAAELRGVFLAGGWRLGGHRLHGAAALPRRRGRGRWAHLHLRRLRRR